MPTSDGPSRFPVFVAPPHGNHQRSPGYVPGRVAPVRSPPPAKAPPPPPIKPHGPPPERRATFSLSEENQRRERAQSIQQRKNTFICFGVSIGAFFLTLILILSLTSGDVLDGQYYELLIQMFMIFLKYNPHVFPAVYTICVYFWISLSNEKYVICYWLVMFAENCPDHNPSLSSWNPGHQPEKAVVVRRGHLFRLDASATFHSLTIQSGGRHITRA